jgi:hypothetical protein
MKDVIGKFFGIIFILFGLFIFFNSLNNPTPPCPCSYTDNACIGQNTSCLIQGSSSMFHSINIVISFIFGAIIAFIGFMMIKK